MSLNLILLNLKGVMHHVIGNMRKDVMSVEERNIISQRAQSVHEFFDEFMSMWVLKEQDVVTS
jgi:hypothetical protein